MILPDDLRLRLLAGLGLLLLIAPLAHPGPAAAAVAAALALFAAERRAVPWRRLWHLEAFLLLLLLTLPFTVPGPPLWQWGPLSLSAEGLSRTLVIGLKVTASVLMLALLAGSVEPERIGAALRSLGLPEALVRIHLGLVRYLGLIRDEMRRLQEAMRLRAFRPRSGWHSWRSYGHLVGMMLVRAHARAERVEEAMRLRHASGRFLRPDLPAPAPRDWRTCALLLALGAGLLWWDRT
ncbi:cobalt ECF transporter T component CbiQ [Cereibacter johrii]|uniref:Cobalt/nickel transport system permease protein n=1 Tax=Cereibacter johrii TaxID=445629 RepID=A0ABX5J5R9_9RHOB|nr:cobalt ECF transporter T component CbiQ [Cereibacter johrii]ODM44612.1 cobalt ECF transporter T component CbiQ [Cereibacter johrii]PTM78254.1 cobalt/nickel transport system permease protein [Cereibacter johrii]